MVVFALLIYISLLLSSVPSHNELPSVIPEVCMLTHLQCLRLEYNKLTELPENIGLLTKLEELDVSHNQLSALPPSLGRMGFLLKLGATHNELKTLPDTIGAMKGNLSFMCVLVCASKIPLLCCLSPGSYRRVVTGGRVELYTI